MRAINHALTGAIIGLSVGEPAVALPTALASHYVLDVIPHFGLKKDNPKLMRTKLFRGTLLLDALLCFLLVVILASRQPLHWFLAASCAFLAAAPDFASVGRFKRALAQKPWRPGIYSKFATGIQWFERPIGAVVEFAWFAAALILLALFIR
jgi:hypothetical protein